MAGGADSNEQSTEVESSATPDNNESNNNDNNNNDSGSQSGETGAQRKRGLSGPHDEPNAYEVERLRRIKRNADVLKELGVASLATQIKAVKLKGRESKAVTIEEADVTNGRS